MIKTINKDSNHILYFDLDPNSQGKCTGDKIGYIEDISQIPSTFNEWENSSPGFRFSKPLVVFDKKNNLAKRTKVVPYTGDLEGITVNIDTNNFDTFIDKIILVSYSLEYWGFVQFRAFVVTDKPNSIYRTMLEFDRLMKYIDPDFI